MTIQTTNALQFAELVQGALRLGVNLATKAFERRDIGFFEAAIAEQGRLLELAKHNVATRPSFELWTASALKADSESFLHSYDTEGTIARLNGILFGEFGRDYYEQFVVPAFDTPVEQLEATFNMQSTTLAGLIEMIKADVLGADDDVAMNDLNLHLNKQLTDATTDELIGVLKRN